MSLSIIGSVIWNLGLAAGGGGMKYDNNLFFYDDALRRAGEVADSPCIFPPLSSSARSEHPLNQQQYNDNEFALCLKIMDANHEIM